jgi:hypothetical protein
MGSIDDCAIVLIFPSSNYCIISYKKNPEVLHLH